MYIPKLYAVQDHEEVYRFLAAHPFSTIVTAGDDRPVATHVPLRLNREGNTAYFTGHFAKGNPHWKLLNDSTVLVIVQGADSYVSASWYKDENISTWNYQAVHVYGTATILSDEELETDLAKLLEDHEAGQEEPITWGNLSPELKREIHGVVGFRIEIEDVQAAFKLSQNRDHEDYENIIDHLERRDFKSSMLADAMKKNKK